MKKILTWSVLVIAALALIVWKLNANKKENDAKTAFVKQSNTGDVPVLVAKVAQTDFSHGFSANGNFEPIRELTYASETSGRILKLLVDEGSVVKQGQQIARVDDQILSTDLEAARANIAQLKVDKERYESAFATGGVTQKQVDDARLQYNLAVSRLEAASRRVSDTYVKAPISGIINKKYVEQGAYLNPGDKMFDIVDVSKLKLSVSVPEAEVVTLKVGDPVKVTSNVYPETSYPAKITFIAAKSDNALNYPVEMEVTNVAGKPLKAGMYGSAHFGSATATPMILIPRSAFVGGVNSNQVYVLQGNTAKLKTVTAGRIYGEQVEIRGGLQVGETVITSGQINLTDGATVTVASSK
ncbi:MAG TPA: efflux RND transporter periplasmic adaptor subunit [Chitinophaga sp.]